MYSCDGGLDLCSNTLSSSLINLPEGPFSEEFVFDFVNTLPDVPDNVPLARAIAFLETSSGADFSSTSVMLYNSFDLPIGFNTPFAPNGTNYQARAEDLILPGTGYYVQVDGIGNVDNLPLQVSVSAFDLGPVVVPESSTWAMMLAGFGALGAMLIRRGRKPVMPT